MKLSMPFKRFEITDQVWELAKLRLERFNHANSKTRQFSNNTEIKKTGAIAESIIELNYPDLHPATCLDFDFVHNTTGQSYDIKASSFRSDPVIYDATVIGHPGEFKADIFVFMAVDKSRRLAWGIGYIDKETYFKKAQFIKAGSKHKKFPIDYDRYMLSHTKLIPFKT